jgi:kinesin family protein C1
VRISVFAFIALTDLFIVAELEAHRTQLSSSNMTLQSDLDTMRQRANMLQEKLLTATTNLDEQIRNASIEMGDIRREHRNEIEQLRRNNIDEVDRLLRLHREEVRESERRAAIELEDRVRELERRNDSKLEDERSRRLREVQDLESRIALDSQSLDLTLQKKDREIENMRGELEDLKGELDREQTLKGNAQKDLASLKETLQKTGVESSTTIQTLESTVASLRARIHFLESGSKAQSDSFADMESRLQDAIRSAEISKQKLIKEESLRRILFNQVQELKGNIRVMCRVRPVFDVAEGDAAKIKFPDTDKESKELELLGKEEKSSLGNITRKTHSFTFDRVFGPESQNQEVFEEISQLVQSALDGYNVCIFCYGQTGSGKTHTMSSADGMIPRATHQIYETATNLKEKGWTYTMEGSFVEVYNEEIHDLLGNSKDFDKKKHEIRHDDQKKQTTVTGLKTVTLDSPDTVETILKQAANNRSVAATKSNERSSRSHSVFILKLVGRNSTTNETSEGTLNLVDLAGSERLKSSGAEGDRMKETQNINKSLSCLGDVIGALGQGKEGAHIPYRNSKVCMSLPSC